MALFWQKILKTVVLRTMALFWQNMLKIVVLVQNGSISAKDAQNSGFGEPGLFLVKAF